MAFVLDGAGLRPYFRVTADGQAVRRPKPDPEVFLHAASRLGVAPHDAIVFEDSHSGVAAARAAGMRIAGLRTTRAGLETDLLIDDFLSPELEPWLRSQTPRGG